MGISPGSTSTMSLLPMSRDVVVSDGDGNAIRPMERLSQRIFLFLLALCRCQNALAQLRASRSVLNFVEPVLSERVLRFIQIATVELVD